MAQSFLIASFLLLWQALKLNNILTFCIHVVASKPVQINSNKIYQTLESILVKSPIFFNYLKSFYR